MPLFPYCYYLLLLFTWQINDDDDDYTGPEIVFYKFSGQIQFCLDKKRFWLDKCVNIKLKVHVVSFIVEAAHIQHKKFGIHSTTTTFSKINKITLLCPSITSTIQFLVKLR